MNYEFGKSDPDLSAKAINLINKPPKKERPEASNVVASETGEIFIHE